MNRKLIVMLGVAALMVGGAFAHGPYRGGWRGGPHHGWHPRPVHHHHCHGGRYFWPGFVGGVIGGAITSTIIDTSPTVVVQQPAVVAQPVVVRQPQQVWVEGRYVDQVQANGSTVRVWQPGHYEQR